jgi:hypothetical protein
MTPNDSLTAFSRASRNDERARDDTEDIDMKRASSLLGLLTLALAVLAFGCDAGDLETVSINPNSNLGADDEASYETSGGVVIAASDLPLAITQVSPSTGPLQGGSIVSIQGQGIGPLVEVRFGEALAANVAVQASSLVTCVAPPGSAGLVDVSLRESDGAEAVLPGAFEYLSQLAVSQVVPTTGPAEGGYLVVIRGAGFTPGTTVALNGDDAGGAQVEGTTAITLTMPPGAPGPVDITVRTLEGEEATLSGAFERLEVEQPEVIVSPAVFSVTPAQGTVAGGTLVVLKGEGFVAGSVVRFGEENAYEVTVQSAELLTVKTPPGSAGSVPITVTVPGGEAAALDPGFTYVDDAQEALAFAALSPSTGHSDGGFLVMVIGTGMGDVATATLGGEACLEITAPSPHTLVFTAPPHAPGSVDLVLKSLEGEEILAEDAFIYVGDDVTPDAAPAVGSLFPTTGPTSGGTPVLVGGSGFHEQATVALGGTAAPEVTWLSSTTLKVIAPAAAAGPVGLTVTNPDGQHVSKSAAFTFVEELETPLTVTSITPSSGPTTGGGLVTVSGAGFDEGLQLWFGPQPAGTLTIVTDTLAMATVPAGEIGTIDLTAVSSGGSWSELESSYSYFAPNSIPAQPPIISAVLPASGWMDGGQTVLLSGVGLSEDTLVHFGALAAEVVSAQGGALLEVVTPAHGTGTVDVTVTSTEGLSTVLTAGFVYFEPPPFIAGLSPMEGPSAGGTDATLHGKNFVVGATVKVGFVSVPDASVTSPTTIAMTMPPHIAGPVTITVTNPSGLADTLSAAFTYTLAQPADAPVISAVVPSDGPQAGGGLVVITGETFAVGASVRFGEVEAVDVVVHTASVLTARVPEGEAGATVSLTVENPSGLSSVLDDAYTWISGEVAAPLSLSAVVPAQGDAAGATVVTLAGTGFVPGVEVSFGELPAIATTWISPSVLTALTPAQGAGVVDVLVQRPDGQQFVAFNSFLYTAVQPGVVAPLLTSTSPSVGPVSGDTLVEVHGVNLQPAAAVWFGAGVASDVTWVNDTLIVARTPEGQQGPVSVTVTHDDGGSAVLPAAFTYYTPVDSVPPTVFSATPFQGSVLGGDMVTIGGNGFEPGVAVFLCGAKALVSESTATMAIVMTGPGPLGPCHVEVVNPDGVGATLEAGFKYVPATPVITSILPANGPVEGGSSVVLQGEGFMAGAAVRFDGSDAESVTVWSQASIQAVVPAGLAGPADVTVINPGGVSTTDPGAFTYQEEVVEAVPPVIETLFPTGGSVDGGTPIEVVGAGFQEGLTVLLGGVIVGSVAWTSETSLQLITPAHAAGPVALTVLNPDGLGATKPAAFSYLAEVDAAPVLLGLSPAGGPQTGGTTVTVSGENLSEGGQLYLGGLPLVAGVVIGETAATGLTPPGPAGPVDLTWIGVDGQHVTLEAAFNYVAGPTLTSVEPTLSTLSGGEVISIFGTNLDPAISIWFGDEQAQVLSIDGGFVAVAIVPGSESAGWHDITVINPDGQLAVLEGAFRYLGLPALGSIHPTQGPLEGGTPVEITGVGLIEGTRVFFGDSEASTLVHLSDQVLLATTPSDVPGPVDIRVEDPVEQSATLTGGYTYNSTINLEPAPSIAAFLPTSGPVGGGIIVTLLGEDFQPGAMVLFGASSSANVTFSGDGVLNATLPPHGAGEVTVTVVNLDGQYMIASESFTYEADLTLSPLPGLTAIAPLFGPTAGGNLVSVYGAGFTAGMQVWFGDAVATSMTLVSETELQVAAPANNAGVVDVSVISADGQQVTLAAAYTVAAPPALLNLVPNSASALGGTLVTLTGGGFIGGSVDETLSTVLLCDDFNADVGCAPAAPEGVSVSGDGTQLSFIAPPHAPGTVDIAIVNPDGQADALLQSFVYNPLPTLTQVSPAITSTLGGASLTVTGTGFQQGVQVSLSGSDCTELLVITSESLTCTAPLQAPGPKDVTLTNPDGGEATLVEGITCVLPPTLTGVSPASGAEAGGYEVTLQGTGFIGSTTGSLVRFGATSVPLEDTEVVSSELIVITVPAGTGLVSVSVDNPDGQSTTLTGAFFYVPPVPAPVLSTIVPNSGLTSGGYITQLVGTGFLEGATVSFGQSDVWADALDVEIKNGGTLITMIAPLGEPGTAAVRVTNTDGQMGIIPGLFEYISPEVTDALSVAAIAPATGLLDGGTIITVTGAGFAPGVYVQFGEDPTWSDGATLRLGPTLLRVTVPSAPTGLSGSVDVRITNPTPIPEVVVIADGYTYTQGAVFTRFTGDRLPPEPDNDIGAQIADVNGDGHNDVFVFRNGTSMQHKSGRLMLNVPDEEGTTGWFERLWTWEDISYLRIVYDMALGDTDEDGDLDAVMLGYSDSLWHCRNDGISSWSCTSLQDQSCASTDVELTDLNCDGHLDIVLARYSESSTCPNQVWLGDGEGLFFRQDDLLPAHFEHTNAIQSADVDLDGDLDLLVANGDAMQNRLYYSNCNNVARPPSCFDPPEGCEVVVNGDQTYAVCTTSYYNYATVRARCALGGMGVLQLNDADEALFFDAYGTNFWIDYSDTVEEGSFVWGTPSNTYQDWCGGEPNDAGVGEDCAQFISSGDGCIQDIACTPSARWVCEIPSSVPQCTEDWVIADALYGAGKNFPISGGNTTDVALVDIDVNGFVDAIVGNKGQQTNVYMNYGGNFSLDTGLQWPQDGDSGIEEIHPADIDLDGDVDLVTLSEDSVRIYVNDHANGGADTFTEDTEVRLPADPARGDIISLAVGDLDSDLHPDIYVVNEHLGDRILLNRGYPNTPWLEDERMPPGHFALNTQMRLPETDTKAQDLAFGDIDDDGDLDIVKCAFGSPLSVHVNEGSGYFTDESDTRVDFAVYECTVKGLELADMDGDGDLDLVVDQIYEDCSDGHCSGAVVLLLNDGQGVFSVSNHSNFGSSPWQSRGTSILDLDGDGDLDILSPGEYTYCCTGTTASVWRNLGDPFNTGEPYFVEDIDAFFSEAKNGTSYYGSIMASVRTSIFADIDGVHPLDLVLARNGQNQLLLGTPDYTWVPVTESWLPAVSDNTTEAIVVDFDGDGDQDIYSANFGQDRAILREAAALYADVTTSSLPDSDAVTRNSAGGAAVDLDGDGLPEIVLANWSAHRTSLLGNLGEGIFADQTANLPEDWDYSRDIYFIDLDGDGDQDIYVLNLEQDRVYENQLVP